MKQKSSLEKKSNKIWQYQKVAIKPSKSNMIPKHNPQNNMNRHNTHSNTQNTHPNNHNRPTQNIRQNTTQNRHNQNLTPQPNLSIIHWNCRSITNKTSKLLEEIRKDPPDVIALQEIALADKNMPKLKNYQEKPQSRKHKRGGGLAF